MRGIDFLVRGTDFLVRGKDGARKSHPLCEERIFWVATGVRGKDAARNRYPAVLRQARHGLEFFFSIILPAVSYRVDFHILSLIFSGS